MHSHNVQDHFFFFFVVRGVDADAAAPRVLPVPVAAPFFGGFLRVPLLLGEVGAGSKESSSVICHNEIYDVPGEGSRISVSSSPPYSVPPSVMVATLSLGVGGTIPSSPLSCVKALLSLSPPISPAKSSLLLPRLRPARVRPVTGCGEGEGDIGEGVSRIRRCEMISSIFASYGRVYSSRKKGCAARLSEGEGERMEMGVECVEVRDS